MKNIFKGVGTQSIKLCAIAMIAIIGLSFATCSNGSTENNTGSKLTIKNSTNLTITSITIEDATPGSGGTKIVDNATVSIAPGETYTSPEMNVRYVHWKATDADETFIFYWNGTARCDWEISGTSIEDYDREWISEKKFPGGY